MEAVEAVTDAVRTLQGEGRGRVIVVALDGRSGAGKSTLAAAIADAVDAAVIHVDDFYRELSDAQRLAMSPAQGVDRYFDWERIQDEAVAQLLRREPARFRPFDWASGRGLTSAVTIEPCDIVIVEGVYSARPEFDDSIDLKVLVEVPNADREKRRKQRPRTISREDPQEWDARWDASERLYFDKIRRRESFDLIVSGTI